MELLKNNFSKNSKSFLLLVVCFTMTAGIFSCNNENIALEPINCPIGTDDASLLAWQMEKIRTKAAVYNVALVTTKEAIEFDSFNYCEGDYTVDWGDGVIETNPTTHTYIDGEAAHTIFIYGHFIVLSFTYSEILYVDISKTPGLKNLLIYNNKLSNINLAENKELRIVSLGTNKLHSIDLSLNTALQEVYVGNNSISALDVSMLPALRSLEFINTEVASIDVSKNSYLTSLMISGTKITSLDVTNNSFLRTLWFDKTSISEVDISKNSELEQFSANNVTNLTSLDLSNNPKIYELMLFYSGINNIILPFTTDYLNRIDTRGCPIEQNLRKMTNLVLSLPDRSVTTPGRLHTSTPHLSTITDLLQGYNWDINPW